MKRFRVGIPCMITESIEPEVGEEHAPPKVARILYFKVTAESADHAAQLMYERLEPYCGDP